MYIGVYGNQWFIEHQQNVDRFGCFNPEVFISNDEEKIQTSLNGEGVI